MVCSLALRILAHMPQPLPSVAACRTRLEEDLRVENRLGIGAVRSHQNLPAIWSHDERAANALAPFPWALIEPANAAGARDPQSKIPSHGTIIVEPKLAVGLLGVVVVSGHGPRAR